MDSLKAIVYNKTEVHLKFKACKNGSEASLKEIGVGVGETKTIDFGKLLKDHAEKIHVLDGDEKVVKVLNIYDFPNKGTELLALEMQDGRVQHAFVHWIWSNVPHAPSEVLLQDQSYTEKSKIRVDNRTELELTFRDHYQCLGEKDFYGTRAISVPPRGTKTIPCGTFLKEFRTRKRCKSNTCTQEIYVLSGEHLVLVLKSDVFKKNQGKELVLDIQDDNMGYAFLPQPTTTSWKNWLCFSNVHK